MEWRIGWRTTNKIIQRRSTIKSERVCLSIWFLADVDFVLAKKGKDTSSKGKVASSKGKAKAKPEPSVEPSISAYRPKVSVEAEADFMSNLLGEIDAQPTPAAGTVRSRKRKPSSPLQDTDSGRSSPGPIDYDTFRAGPSYEDRSSDVEELMAPSSDDHMFSPKKRIRVDSGAATPATERLAQLDFNSGSDADVTLDEYTYDDIDMDAFMDIDEDIKKPDTKKESLDTKTKANEFKNIGIRQTKLADKGTPAWLSVYDSLSTTTPDSLEPLASASTSTTVKDTSVLESDGSLRFFWLDYLELDGKIYFTGKLRDKGTGAWHSCCVTVEGLQRNLFALPREKIVEEAEDNTYIDTDVVPSSEDVYNDFDMIRKQLNIKSWKAKFVKRKYAFGEKKVPRGESQWLKVVYGFNGQIFEVLVRGRLKVYDNQNPRFRQPLAVRQLSIYLVQTRTPLSRSF